MKKLILLVIMLAGGLAANQRAQGWCEAGAQTISVGGVPSSSSVQGSFPACLVTINIHGGGLATIYSDNSNTPLANPFHGSAAGIWFFYAANNHYDVTLCSDVLVNNTCNGPLAAFTIYDILLDDPASGPSTVSSVTGSGSGISVSPTTGAVVVANTGVTGLTAGSGIGLSGATGTVTVTNSGVTSLASGTGIGLSGSAGAVTATNTGVTGLVAGSGIGLSGGTGNVTITNTSTLPSGTQTQFLRIQPNTGNNSTYQFSSFHQVTATDYNWPTQTPGGTLLIGSVSITLNPVPLGIGAGFVGQYVWISGGTGTAEAALVTGFSSPNLIVTVVNNHSGAWTIQSATGGGGEAFATGASSIYFPSNAPSTFYGPLVIGFGGNVQITGDSVVTAAIIRASTNVTGDLFYVLGSLITGVYPVYFFDLNINNGPGQTGRAIHAVYDALFMDSVYCFYGIFVDQDSTGFSNLTNLFYYTAGAPSAVLIYRGSPTTARGCTSARLSSSQLAGGAAGILISVTGVDYLSIDNVLISLATTGGYGVLMKPDLASNSYISTVYITNSQFNPIGGIGISLQATTGASAGVGAITIANNEIQSQNGSTSQFGIDIGCTSPGTNTGFGPPLADIQVVNNRIWDWGYSGICTSEQQGGGDMSVIIADNKLYDNNVRAISTLNGNISLSYPQGIQITNNRAGNAVAGPGIWIAGSIHATNDLISGNTLINNPSGPIYIDSGLLASVILSNNIGINDQLPAIPAATTFPFPFSPNFTITGNSVAMSAATLTDITVNSSGTFRCTGTGVTIVASGGWGNAGTCTQNVLFNWFYDGTSIWWK